MVRTSRWGNSKLYPSWYIYMGAKQGQFDDGKKMMDGLLFDSTEDLQDAIKKEQKVKELKKKKEKKLNEKVQES